MILLGDCLERLKELPANSVDSVVTDPPYGLKFMGKKWDHSVPSVEVWREVLRVLKPGGHLLSFGGTRTYHRMVVNIEDAGFEIRDQLQWLYGSGFPKSLDVSKAIDKAAGAEREVIGESLNNRPSKRRGAAGFDSANEIGSQQKAELRITAPATDDAKRWQGFGTALKPAFEPIVLARKPLDGTVAQNVLKHGVGGLNIDASRIGTAPMTSGGSIPDIRSNNYENSHGKQRLETPVTIKAGRWPSNVILGCDCEGEEHGQVCAVAMLDAQSGVSASRYFYVAKASKRERNAGLEGMPEVECQSGMGGAMPIDDNGKERDRFKTVQSNHHPTVKPIKLMQYLIKLITPPGGVVLDPFLGSGSTAVAAKSLGFEYIGIELNAEYIEIAKRRIEAV